MRAHTIKNILFTPPNLKNDLKLDLFPRKMDIQHPCNRPTRIDFSTIHRSAQETGSSELWRILSTSRIVCCLAEARQQKLNFSKRCNSCPECPNNTKFCLQTNFRMKILILSSISAEYADKRWLLYSKVYI